MAGRIVSMTGKDPVDCGIYKIQCTVNEQIYVGQSLSISTRIKHHIRSLRKGDHHNSGLQLAWNSYGEEVFDFSVVEITDPESLSQREGYWVRKYNCLAPNGFNIAGISCVPGGGHLCEIVNLGEWTGYRRLSDGYWSGNVLANQFDKRVDNWSRTLCGEVAELLKPEKTGTWIHPDALIFFLPWLSPSIYFCYMNHLRRLRPDLDYFVRDCLSAAQHKR